MSPRRAALVAGTSGFLALSAEILWVRAVSNAWQGRPAAFATLLGCFLLGVAAGALVGRRTCEKNLPPAPFLASMFTAAGAVAYFALPLGSRVVTLGRPAGIATLCAAAAAVALLLGAVLPVVVHHGAGARAARGPGGGGSVGSAVGRIYAASIAGSTLGPLVTGFVLLDVATLEHSALLLAVACFAAAAPLWVAALPRRRQAGALGLLAVGAAGMLWFQPPLYHDLFARLHDGPFYSPTRPYRELIQNRSGVVGTGYGGTLYGGGVYDGRFNVDPVHDTNMIRRAYLLPALHPAPRRLLVIGLGTGSWTRVLADHAGVEAIDVVEINPAYPQIVARHPVTASVLDDPKVTLHVDDGRRWLVRHRDRRFDAIVMNTTFHWREHASNLLSVEFLELCRERLAPGGLVYFNTTGSEDAARTAAEVFEHVVRYRNFVAGSDRPFRMAPGERRRALRRFRRGGAPVFRGRAAAVLEELASVELPDVGPALRARRDLWVITDDNLASELKAAGPGRWWRETLEVLGLGGGPRRSPDGGPG